MENNPKKSKAFIITFILILLLLLGGYYLFKNRAKIFDAKGSTSVAKIFSPLLGSSKSKDVKVINTDTTNTTDTTPVKKKTGTVLVDANGNKVVLAQAGENLKKGDVLYIAGWNESDQPILMKAIANDKTKSLVFGVAGEDMDKGKLGNVIIEGILSGVPTNRREGTLWVAKNPLYLSDKTYGGMTKNPPVAPSFVVTVGSVIKVDKVNGSIQIGALAKNRKINSELLRDDSGLLLVNGNMLDLRDYWNSIFGDGTYDEYNIGGMLFNPINLPNQNPNLGTKSCSNGAINYPLCNTLAPCKNGAIDPPTCKVLITNPNDKKCVNKATNFPLCTTLPVCKNGATNPTLCDEFPVDPNDDKVCGNEATNYPECTTKNGECVDKTKINPPTCDKTNVNVPNKCLLIEQNPLTFTEAEKARLAVLLRKFYLISSTLRTSEDIATIYNEVDQQENFITQIGDLTKQCYAQIPTTKLAEQKWVRHGNPWYPNEKWSGAYPYTNDTEKGYLDFKWLQDEGPGCKVVSGYYYGTGTDASGGGYDCNVLNTFTFTEYKNCDTINSKIFNNITNQPDLDLLKTTGCKWKDGVNLKDTERLLNIW